MLWSNKSELEAALRDAGLGFWAQTLAERAQRCILLIAGPIEEGGAAPLGASRLGGEPDMPPDFDWPIRPAIDDSIFPAHGGGPWPLSFVAQIDFAELQAVQILDEFPPEGRLLLFCDPVDIPWGAKEDQARMRVIFTTIAADRLRRRPCPLEFDQPREPSLDRRSFIFKPRILRPTAWLLPPLFIALLTEQPRADRAAAFSAYERFWDDLEARHGEPFGDDTIHQVGGMAFSIQDPVEAECVKYADDRPRPRAWWQRWLNLDEFTKAQRAAHLAQADNWQLVLQVSSDLKAGMQWGDMGRLYLCARKQDLAARRFDQSWMVVQCY
jgi:uncharacterized protein YwqG